MKVLILDDEKIRHDSFDSQYEGCEVWHAYNLKQFRESIRKVGKFDVISFDHDIHPSDRETGYEAALYLIGLHHAYTPTMCVVHSWNPDGAKRIAWALSDAGFTVRVNPFSAAKRDAFSGWVEKE